MVALTQNPRRPKSTAISAKIRRIWLDASGLSHQSAETLNATSIVVAEDRRGCEVQSHALNSTRTRILAQVEGLRLAVVNTTAKNSSNSQEADREQVWNPVWQPDIDLMTLTERQQWCMELPNDSESDTDELADFYRDLAFLHYSYLKQVINDDMTPQQPHLQQYLQWAKEQVQRVESGRTPHWGDDWKMLAQDLGGRQVIENKLLETNAQGKAHVEVARHLDQILADRLDPLEFLFTSPLLDNLYAELSDHRMACFKQLDRYLKLFAHKTPNARYLEIGAGTGGTTAAILSSLQGDEAGVGSAGTLYQDFTYSDISEAFFDAAKSRFGRYPNMLFRQLDISKNVAHQGFIEGSYDVIVAANVLHATEDLRATLETVQTLLRPGGKLILFEITAPELGRSGFIMGLLPGWWLSSEGYRPRGPCVASATWNTLFEEAGFTGLEHEFYDYIKDESYELSVLITSKKPEPSAAMLQRQTASESATDTINIVPSSIGLSKENGHFKNAIAIQKYLHGIGLSSQLISMDKISRSTGLTIVTADLDLERPFLEKMCPRDFAAMQNLISRSQNLVWVTRTVDDGSSSPSYNMIAGLVRVIHAEEEGHRLLRVGLEPISSDGPSESQMTGLLSAIQQMIGAASADTFEMEFEQRNGLFQIPRLKLDTECQDGIHEILHPQVSRDLPWNQAPLPLRLTTETPGLLESLRFVVDEDQQKVPLADDEVEIEVRAVGVNFKDCLIALGRVPAETLGNECAGIVTRVGASYRSKFTIGDRVCMSTVEAFKTFARSKAQGVCRLPDSMDFTTAAAIPTQFVTAWTSLREIGRLTRGESVLIHAGAGGTGQAAVQISQYLGAEVFVTVSSDAKKRLLTTTYGIPEDHIFYSRDTSFAVGVKNATGGRGVNLVLNSLSGDSLLASWDCLAPYGRFVEIGKKDILENASYLCSPSTGASAERGIHAIMDLFKQNVFHVAEPLQIRPVSEVREAFAALADGKTSGKTVISITPTAIVPMTIPRVSSSDTGFPSDATYVLAGGFGGIGRSIARWMAQRGARSLLILSRSGPRTPEACSLVQELTRTGVAVQAPACDITDSRALQSVISECQRNMSPIRGCIQASMVLQDTLLRDMTHPQWAAAVDPKVVGTWNLHTCLEKERLSFFICLSSVSGVAGQRGQSNYAAGNTFQDSLARYRIARGQPAVSLDLGAMVDDGFLTQNQAVRERLVGGGSMLPVTREKFLAVLEYYCCRLPVAGMGNSQLTIANSQTVFGVNTPQAMYARGLDLPNWMQRPIFSFLHRAFSSSQQTHRGRNQRDFRADIAQATTIEKATQIIADALVSKLVRSLSALEAEKVKVDMPIVSYGVDSLLAVEIRSWLGSTFQADVPTFEILGGIDFERLGRLVAIRSTAKKGWA
ncbi:hypothetical protein N7470_009128 [Penicillium chermesinum]|nr:hypothetical protein N7470_009128 [Penicillium chermesinum]